MDASLTKTISILWIAPKHIVIMPNERYRHLRRHQLEGLNECVLAIAYSGAADSVSQMSIPRRGERLVNQSSRG